nr:MAG TPA: hypothetical protein [Caudoviricetes sp.]DAU94181.1 MAG TPA: hypothetical protein [Caudoviricetes sp.]
MLRCGGGAIVPNTAPSPKTSFNLWIPTTLLLYPIILKR